MRAFALVLAGAVLVLGLLEIALRVLPGPTATLTGYYFDPLLRTYPAHHKWWTASGWDLRNARHMESNNFGFATSRDFDRNESAVALIGDSFVEASALPEADGLGSQLESRLEGRPVFAMGVPGSNLLDYAERIRFAAGRLGVRDFVLVLERGDVRQSLCGSGNVSAVCLDSITFQPRVEKQAPPTFIKSALRDSRAAQYLFGQLRLDPARLLNTVVASMNLPAEGKPVEKVEAGITPAPASTYVDAVFNQFLERASRHVKGRLIVVLDADRNALYRAANGEPMTTEPDRARFLELARARGVEVIDLEPLFAAHIAQSTVKLEVSPSDAHWNPVATAIVATAIAARLRSP